jgi:hypothetical protein
MMLLGFVHEARFNAYSLGEGLCLHRPIGRRRGGRRLHLPQPVGRVLAPRGWPKLYPVPCLPAPLRSVEGRAERAARRHRDRVTPFRRAEDHAALMATIPGDFWRELREQGLVAAAAPLPIDW